jgi:L-ascorbate metabolism protein UlaG (beta-lactamase superfamily)
MVKNVVFTIKWLGHASFRIIVNGFNIYVDPYEGTYVDKADIILLSHEHFDHCDISKIEKIRKEETIIIAPSTCLNRIKGKVKVLKAGEKITINYYTIEAVQAYNIKRFRSPDAPFHPKDSGLGYLITASGKTIYYAGDTDFVQEMNKLKNVFLAILPTGGTYTMDNPEAAEATLAIKPQVAIPMHTLDSDPKQFKNLVEQSSKIKVILLNQGEKYEFE